ncbi:MAG: deoxynucleoside kinase [Chloroflexi bacterium]|nr:deoxynucleoside kinase [Chloroflexota bacterium]MCL5273354.1 deoxynucleoside kinase [Chloroflexota bacterium]
MKYFVAVAGNIGAGKSSLAGLLAHKLGWEAFFEPVEENPYLADFYADMPRWGFQSQVFFLARRLRHYRGLLNHPGSVIQDRSVYEDAEIFAYNLYRQGYMSERDWNSYHDLYEAVMTLLPPPNLVVYLRTSVATLANRIARRGRELEHNISPDYLAQLNDMYEAWIAGFNLCPVLTIATDDLDFAHDSAHLDQIARRITDRLQGKEVITLKS